MTIDAALSDLTIPGETITVMPGTYFEGNLSVVNRTLQSSSGDPSTTIIDATGLGVLVMSVTGSSVTGLTIRKGSNPSGIGGGIRHGGGLVVLEDLVIEENSAQNGAGIGGETGGSDLEINRCTIQNNTATVTGGGLRAAVDETTISQSIIRGNMVAATGSSAIGGGIEARSFTTVVINDSTISGNSVTGATTNLGGGISAQGTIFTVNNSTISGNSVSGVNARGGGLYITTNMHLNNATVSGNSANDGAGLYRSNGSFVLTGTIVANSTGDSCNAGAVTDNGGNLADDATCGTIPATLTGLDPNLIDNGGPTYTHALLPGSNAIDAGGICGLLNDQRGVARVGSCDTGAFELIDCIDKNLMNATITTTQVEEACHTARLGPSFVIESPGNLTITAGVRIILLNGVSIGPGAELTMGIDPDLQVLSLESLILQGRAFRR